MICGSRLHDYERLRVFHTASELSMGRLDQARTRPEPENASPNQARTRK